MFDLTDEAIEEENEKTESDEQVRKENVILKRLIENIEKKKNQLGKSLQICRLKIQQMKTKNRELEQLMNQKIRELNRRFGRQEEKFLTEKMKLKRTFSSTKFGLVKQIKQLKSDLQIIFDVPAHLMMGGAERSESS